MGTRPLQASDKSQLVEIESAISQLNAKRRSRAEYLGWLAFELGDIEDRYQRPEAVAHFATASQRMLGSLKDIHPSDTAKQLLANRNVALFDLRHKVVESRIYGDVVDPVVTRNYIGELALFGCEQLSTAVWNNDSRQKNNDTVGAITELLFTTLFVDTLVDPELGLRLLPQPSTPRQESPITDERYGVCSANKASDLILKHYPTGWFSGNEHAVQLKTNYKDKVDRAYDKTSVTMLYSTAQLGVETNGERRQLVEAIVAPDRTSHQAQIVKNAHLNVFLELGF